MYREGPRYARGRNVRSRHIDHLIASHPSAWAHGYMLQDDTRPHVRHFVPTTTRAPRRRSTSPREWYYRHHRVRPITREQAYRTRPFEPREVFERRSSSQQQQSSVRYSRSPVRNALNPPHPPWRDIRAVRDRYRRFSQRGTESEDNHRRVRFVRGTNGHAQRRREDQAARDFAEENRDQRYLNNAKRHARHQVHEGGGAFEIDGHYSGEYPLQCEAVAATLDICEQSDILVDPYCTESRPYRLNRLSSEGIGRRSSRVWTISSASSDDQIDTGDACLSGALHPRIFPEHGSRRMLQSRHDEDLPEFLLPRRRRHHSFPRHHSRRDIDFSHVHPHRSPYYSEPNYSHPVRSGYRHVFAPRSGRHHPHINNRESARIGDEGMLHG